MLPERPKNVGPCYWMDRNGLDFAIAQVWPAIVSFLSFWPKL
jgi:hypothetical protein